MSITEIKNQIFEVNSQNFEKLALDIFQFQYQQNNFYKQYVDLMHINPKEVISIYQIPFLPIQFFKSQTITTPSETSYELFFESSGTTGQIRSKHYLVDVGMYVTSFQKSFEKFFGDIKHYCILGLLPSYIDRPNASLAYMVNHLIQKSGHPQSGFYLDDFKSLYQTIQELEAKKQDTLLFGVTFALLDFASEYSLPLQNVKIIETGGMKGRGENLTKSEIYSQLQTSFGKDSIYSEYGMTELLSQAYATKPNEYKSAPWLKILVRDLNDPKQISSNGKGAINIIDLANIHSCCFIATDDFGTISTSGSFEIQGRIDQSELRGCSLMTM